MSFDALMARIAEEQHPELYAYVLIDPLAIANDSSRAILPHLQRVLGDKALHPVYRNDMHQAPELHPVLVSLASPGGAPCQSLLKMTARIALEDVPRRSRQICGWLFSEAPGARIAAHLSSICQLPTQASGRHFYPVYEPVRLELFVMAFERLAQGPWWPVKAWVFITSGGAPAGMPGRPGPPNPVPLGAHTIQSDASLIEALLAAWRALVPLPARQPVPPLPALAAFDALEFVQQARTCGLSESNDIFVLVLHCLSLHPKLHTHPRVRNMIDRAVQQQRPLAHLFGQYDELLWRHVVADLPRSEATR